MILENMNKQNLSKLIIGLGTGRCGTVSLTRLLQDYPDSYFVHESAFFKNRQMQLTVGEYLPWIKNKHKFNRWVKTLEKMKDGAKVYGDVCSSLIQYVPEIIEMYPNVIFVCLQRDRTATVGSFLRLTKYTNHWNTTHPFHLFDFYQELYPSYNHLSKKEAIEHYWDMYYELARDYENKYSNFKIFSTESLSNTSGINMILKHCDIEMSESPLHHLNKQPSHSLIPFILRLFLVPLKFLRR